MRGVPAVSVQHRFGESENFFNNGIARSSYLSRATTKTKNAKSGPPDETTPPTTMASCQAELLAADTCVQADLATCGVCFEQPFMETFPIAAELYYKTTQAFVLPGEPGYCDRAYQQVCEYLETTASCCCAVETKAYTTCAFVSCFRYIHK
jgi:hypothetical protein